jgi:hypothetical protein
VSFRLSLSAAVATACLAASGCVGYRPLCASAPAVEADIPTITRDALSFEEAVVLLVERNPELIALRAEAAAVNLRPGPEDLIFSTELRDGHLGDTTIGTDVLSLFGLGKTGAERALARAVLHEAWANHHEKARELVGLLAEAYATDRALRHVWLPKPERFVDAFRRAGLVSDADVAAAEAASAQAEAEDIVRGLAVEDARREIARLLGASPESRIVPVEPPAAWPVLERPDARDVLFARADVQHRFAQFVRSDYELRLAIAEQIPGVSLHLGQDIDLKDPLQILEISLPVSAPAKARAAHSAREAAFRKFSSGVRTTRRRPGTRSAPPRHGCGAPTADASPRKRSCGPRRPDSRPTPRRSPRWSSWRGRS